MSSPSITVELEAARALRQTPSNESRCIRCHIIDGVWRSALGASDSTVIEGDDAVFLGQAVDGSRVPIIENSCKMVKQDDRNAILFACLSIHEGSPVHVNPLGNHINISIGHHSISRHLDWL